MTTNHSKRAFRISRHFLFGAAVLMLGIQNSSAAEPQGFTRLFDGATLSGWHGNNPHETAKAADKEAAVQKQQAAFREHWKAEDGILINDGKGPYATTDADYHDFELVLEYKLAPKADSGIYLRGTPQVQIWDTTEAGGNWKHDARKGSGGLWNNEKGSPGRDPLVYADRPIGEWNQLKIRLVGSRTWVWLNGELVVDAAILRNYWSKGKTPLPRSGPIHLQTHGAETYWRNIHIREIGSAEANTLLSELNDEGFMFLFNGNNFAGWKGALDQYAIDEGSIVSKAGGNIYTADQYADFAWRMEFKLPPGGNNGLAIRYPGQGNPAYVGMCELQVLDDSAKKYADLDTRQYHGSIYGKVPAIRGYLRAPGEWNYQEVQVVGSRIRVELNGTVILDADQSKVTEFMKGNFTDDIPESGHLGFAGHGKGVAFRNLSLKKLSSPEGCMP
jgi:hypothetical protein